MRLLMKHIFKEVAVCNLEKYTHNLEKYRYNSEKYRYKFRKKYSRKWRLAPPPSSFWQRSPLLTTALHPHILQYATIQRHAYDILNTNTLLSGAFVQGIRLLANANKVSE